MLNNVQVKLQQDGGRSLYWGPNDGTGASERPGVLCMSLIQASDLPYKG